LINKELEDRIVDFFNLRGGKRTSLRWKLRKLDRALCWLSEMAKIGAFCGAVTIVTLCLIYPRFMLFVANMARQLWFLLPLSAGLALAWWVILRAIRTAARGTTRSQIRRKYLKQMREVRDYYGDAPRSTERGDLWTR